MGNVIPTDALSLWPAGVVARIMGARGDAGDGKTVAGVTGSGWVEGPRGTVLGVSAAARGRRAKD